MPKPRSTAPSSIQIDRYEIVEMDRRELKGAPYNPRRISDAARQKLKRGLGKFGMLAPPVWNKRSGLLVGGHQRLTALDQIHKTADYRLKIAVVDLSEAEEREANILLNNQEAAGEWDIDGLATLLKTPELQLDATGFDGADLFRLFGEDVTQLSSHAASLDEAAARVRAFRDAYKPGKLAARAKEEDFYCVVIFRDANVRQEFLTSNGLDDNRYQDSRAFIAACGGTHKPSEPLQGTNGKTQVSSKRKPIGPSNQGDGE